VSDKQAVIFTTANLSNIPSILFTCLSISKQAKNGNIVTSDHQTPVLPNPTDVYSTTLPENLRTTDPLIVALANYTTGVQNLFANLAGMKENMAHTGFFKVSLKLFETIIHELR
jgi:hypothetical protein